MIHFFAVGCVGKSFVRSGCRREEVFKLQLIVEAFLEGFEESLRCFGFGEAEVFFEAVVIKFSVG